MKIQQALTRSHIIHNVLQRHEQCGVFAAEGYARVYGKLGVCTATSGPGATNLVFGLADALLDSVPLIAIIGQVPHNYLVLDVDDIPHVVKEAFYLARTGRPDPVLIDVPKDIQQQLCVPKWDEPMRLPGERAHERGVEYVMNKILGFYKECLELGIGLDDEGEVT
nr:acetolactate synthase [Tanacetum cinerariifolium]